MRRRLVSSDQSRPGKKQHTQPCGDCPLRRDSINGWLGGSTPESWVSALHGEQLIECHTRGQGSLQCAGSSIYRANVGKLPRDKENILLPKDKVKVFATPVEFLEHHHDLGGLKR